MKFLFKEVCATCFISISTFSTELDTLSTHEKKLFLNLRYYIEFEMKNVLQKKTQTENPYHHQSSNE